MASKQLVKRSRKSFTRLARFFNQLMREQLMCGPVTVQQCYTLEALTHGPLYMKDLAAEVAERVEIGYDAQLAERYGWRIPVLRIEPGGVELDWPFGAADVTAAC